MRFKPFDPALTNTLRVASGESAGGPRRRRPAPPVRQAIGSDGEPLRVSYTWIGDRLEANVEGEWKGDERLQIKATLKGSPCDPYLRHRRSHRAEVRRDLAAMVDAVEEEADTRSSSLIVYGPACYFNDPSVSSMSLLSH